MRDPSRPKNTLMAGYHVQSPLQKLLPARRHDPVHPKTKRQLVILQLQHIEETQRHGVLYAAAASLHFTPLESTGMCERCVY